ncbi:MAG: ATP-binding protein [Candidatus Saccharibacteria bacterium]
MKRVTIKHFLKKSTQRVQILSVALLLAMGIIGFAFYVNVVNGSKANAFSGAGRGSVDDPYQITSCDQLQLVGRFQDSEYVLMNDVDCSDTINWNDGAGFAPISGSQIHLDGRNYAIKDLYINRPNELNVGFFGSMNDGDNYVRNLTFSKSIANKDRIDINGGRNAGTISGSFSGEIRRVQSSLNIQVNGKIKGQDGLDMTAGGLVGTLNGGLIEKSSSSGKVTVAANDQQGRTASLGGLVGTDTFDAPYDSSGFTIEDSYASGSVSAGTGIKVPASNCGGLIGSAITSIGNPNSANSVDSGALAVYRSYSSAAVSCVNPDATMRAGGLIGLIENKGTAKRTAIIRNNFSVSNVTSNDGVGFGLFGEYLNSNNLDPATTFESNTFDGTKTTKTACGKIGTETNTCTGVNTDGLSPDYFKNLTQQPVFSTWSINANPEAVSVWVLSDPYPTIRPIATRPNAPTNLSVIRSDQNFVLSWDATTGTDGRAENITNYVVFYKVVSDGDYSKDWQQASVVGGNVLTATISNLAVPAKYLFKVKAVSSEYPAGQGAINEGIYSNALQFATGMPGTAPLNFSILPSAKSVVASWDALDTATKYTIEYRKLGASDWSQQITDSDVTSASILDLQAGTDYQFRIFGTNNAGPGPASSIVNKRTTTQSVYSVGNCQQLQNVNNDLSGIYVQTANIDCSSIPNFAVIGGASGVFRGNYDGKGFTISNLTISSDVVTETTDWTGIGLFGNTSGSVLQNITIKDSTIVGNYKLSESLDKDQNGLPDAPSVGGIVDGVGLPATVDENGDPITCGLNEIAAVDIASCSAVVGGAVITNVDQVGNNIAPIVDQTSTSAINFPQFSVGGIAGVVVGTGTYSNLKVLNTTIQGSIAGSVFGAVLPIPSISAIPQELNQNNLEKLTASLTLDGLSSSGSVNGLVGGGLIGFGTSSLGSIVGLGGALTIQNSASSSIVEANVGGGIVGAGLSLSAAALAWTVPKLIRADADIFGSAELLNAVNTTVSNQDIIIKNSTATGSVSTCNSPTEVRAGVIGGLVGLGIGTSIQNSTATGSVSTCSSTVAGNLPVYGGFMGGIGGALLSSKVDSSTSSGSITAKRNTGEYDTETPIFVGASGGISGLFLGLKNDPNESASINDSSSSSPITITGNDGLVSFSGGLNGIYIGEGTISNAHASGAVTTMAAKENVASVSISGGLNGFTVGADLTWARGNALDWSKIGPVGQGVVIDNSYATGAVVTDKGQSDSGMIGITGGLGGFFIGQGVVSNSYASGAVTSNIPENIKVKPPQGQNATILDGVLANNFGTTISGGLFGSAYGADTALAGSNVLAATGFRSFEQVQSAYGMKIINSYATGNIKGNTVGGLLGSAELKIQINKAYATGDVRGEIVGGLIGQSGLLGTAGVGGLGAGALAISGGLSGILDGVDSVQARSAAIASASSIFQASNSAISPLEITNTYNTGNLTTVPFSVDVSDLFNEPGYENTIPARAPTVAGGIVGIYSNPSGTLSNSYASGNITVQAPADVPRNPKIKVADIPSFAGGIFGVDLAIPIIEYKKILNDIPSSTIGPLSNYAQSPTKLENVFSASNISIADKTFSGATSGFFASPLNALHKFLLGGDPKDMDNDKIFKNTNVFVDNARVKAESCNGPNGSLSDTASRLWNNSFISDNNGDNILPPLTISPENKTTIDSQVIATGCQRVNSENNNTALFKNSTTDGPLGNWDFSNIWKVRKDDYPKFVAGAITETPNGPTPIAPGAPVSPEPGSPIIAVAVTPPIPRLYNAARKVAIRQGLVKPEIKQVRGLKTLLANVPIFIARSIPYTLILALLILASLYSWQALRAYSELRTFHKNIMRVLDTKEAVENYLAITTHYLNTPAAIMGGAVELLESLKKISAAQAKSLKQSIKKFADDAAQLLVANQVSGAQANNDELKLKQHQKNPLQAPGVWVPALIAFGLIALANVLFIYADVFNASPYRLAVEFGLFILSVGLVALAYRYRNFLEASKELARNQLKLEAQLYNKRTAFLPQATKVTTENSRALQLASAPLKSVPEAKLFFNGLAMLTGISTELANLEKFADFNAKPPLFDISSFAKKAVANVSVQAKAKNLTINTEVDAGLVSRIQPEEIRQLVESLLDNAVKFSNDNGVVGLNIYRKFNKLVISVSDTGSGISEHKLPSLLKPFSRGTDSMQYNHEGLGLGLYSNKVIVDKLGGTIRIDSKVGKGTTVTVAVPSRHDAVAFAPVFINPDTTPA